MRLTLDQKWQYNDGYAPPAPVFELQVQGAELECLVDTGFSGGVLIPFPTFESLGLLVALSRDEFSAVMPDGRRLPLFTSKATVRIGSVAMETDVHSSPALDRSFVGRGFLQSLVTVLDGPGSVVSVSTGAAQAAEKS